MNRWHLSQSVENRPKFPRTHEHDVAMMTCGNQAMISTPSVTKYDLFSRCALAALAPLISRGIGVICISVLAPGTKGHTRERAGN